MLLKIGWHALLSTLVFLNSNILFYDSCMYRYVHANIQVMQFQRAVCLHLKFSHFYLNSQHLVWNSSVQKYLAYKIIFGVMVVVVVSVCTQELVNVVASLCLNLSAMEIFHMPVKVDFYYF